MTTEQKPITGEVQGYCLKCREKRIMKNPERVIMKNQKPASKGNCPECNRVMYRMGEAS